MSYEEEDTCHSAQAMRSQPPTQILKRQCPSIFPILSPHIEDS